MIDFISHVFIGSALSNFVICYIFGLLDELTKIEYATDLEFFETAIEDTKELRFIPRQFILSWIYFSKLAYYSGVWTIKLLRSTFRFLILKE